MPLPVFIAVGLTACAVIAAYAHWLGRSERRALADAQEAQAIFEAACPDFDVEQALPAGDRHAALVGLKGGELGLLYAMGSKWMARDLPPGSVKSVRRLAGSRLRITLADYAMPRLTIALRDDDEAARWTALLAPLAAAPEGQVAEREATA